MAYRRPSLASHVFESLARSTCASTSEAAPVSRSLTSNGLDTSLTCTLIGVVGGGGFGYSSNPKTAPFLEANQKYAAYCWKSITVHERAIAIMARLHRVKEEATQAVGMQQLWEIRRGYSTEVCDQYTNCIQSLDLCLKVTDLMTYIPYYARITRELVAYGVEPNDIEGLVTSGRESSTENNSRIKCPCW